VTTGQQSRRLGRIWLPVVVASGCLACSGEDSGDGEPDYSYTGNGGALGGAGSGSTSGNGGASDNAGNGGAPGGVGGGGSSGNGGESGNAGGGGAPGGAGSGGSSGNEGGGGGGAPSGGSGGTTSDGLKPYATWYSALDDANGPILGFTFPPVLPLMNATVRQIAHVSLGGSRIRIKLSNRYGVTPLAFAKVRVASSLTKGAIDGGTDTAVTFGGATSVTIDAGKDVWGDPIDFAVDSRGDVAVSAYVPGTADVATEHRFAQRTNYVTLGDSTSSPDVTATAQTITAGYWLEEVDIFRSNPVNVIVGFGDSITDGNGSTADANLRYPDQLSRLALASNASQPELSVVNAGIGGNRWLHDGLGPKASGRFARDALAVTGVSHVVILLGINDIGFSIFSAAEAASAADIIAAITSATRSAQAAHLKVFLGTLLPFAGSLYYTTDGDAKRSAVNDWIRSKTVGDGFFDFDQLLRDPADPTKYAASYDSGDHLHPNDTGYAVMAKAIDLPKLR